MTVHPPCTDVASREALSPCITWSTQAQEGTSQLRLDKNLVRNPETPEPKRLSQADGRPNPDSAPAGPSRHAASGRSSKGLKRGCCVDVCTYVVKQVGRYAHA